MTKPVRLGLFLCFLSAATACQSIPKQGTPLWNVKCGGVSKARLDAAYQAALNHVRQKGLDEKQFKAEVRNCPKKDLRYYTRVLAL